MRRDFLAAAAFLLRDIQLLPQVGVCLRRLAKDGHDSLYFGVEPILSLI